MHGWGSRGRRFKSGRPDCFSNACTPNWERKSPKWETITVAPWPAWHRAKAVRALTLGGRRSCLALFRVGRVMDWPDLYRGDVGVQDAGSDAARSGHVAR
jgi:hypothetical protein